MPVWPTGLGKGNTKNGSLDGTRAVLKAYRPCRMVPVPTWMILESSSNEFLQSPQYS